jgi:hypothetical protein
MGRLHEEYLARVNSGRKSKASGNQWTDPGDGRNHHDVPFALAWDGKSTKGKGLTVTLDMIAKIREQALGEVPEIGLRWYANDSLRDVTEDWVAVPGSDWEEILAAAREWAALCEWIASDPDRAQVTGEADAATVGRVLTRYAAAAEGLRRELGEAHKTLLAAGERIAVQQVELETLRGQAESQSHALAAQAIQHVPMLPWALIRMLPRTDGIGSAGDDSATVTSYAADGTLSTWRAKQVRVEHSADGHPKIFVDDVQVRDADLHDADGKHLVRACRSDPSIEVG